MNALGKRLGVVSAVVFVAIQFVPVAHTNPALIREVDAPEAVREILRRSCYDCHSNQTRWPWYSRVAPISWLVSHDVEEGRQALNFSTWDRPGSELGRREAPEECWEEIEEQEMPPWPYVCLHPSARLGDADLRLLANWAGETFDRTGHAGDGDDDDDD